MIEPRILEGVLMLTGISLVALGVLHAPFWKLLGWGEEARRLSPLNGRVFLVHAFFIAFVLVAVGLLLALQPSLLVERSPLARLLLFGLTAFFGARLVAEPLVFDPVLAPGWRWRNALRLVVNLGWVAYVLVFAAAVANQLQWQFPQWGTLRTWIRVGIAAVWLTFGLAFKALNLVPRHRQIVARILGERYAAMATVAIGAGECAIGLWMLSGWMTLGCVALQTALIATMNAIEIRYARDLLWSARAMVALNACLLAAGWYVAL